MTAALLNWRVRGPGRRAFNPISPEVREAGPRQRGHCGPRRSLRWCVAGRRTLSVLTVSRLLSAEGTKGCSSYSVSPPPHPGRFTSPFTGSAPPPFLAVRMRAPQAFICSYDNGSLAKVIATLLCVGLSLRSRQVLGARQPTTSLETCTLSLSQNMTGRPCIKDCFEASRTRVKALPWLEF